MSTELTIAEETFVPQQFTWTDADLKALHESTCKSLSSAEFKVFILNARRRGLDPFAKQIYAWKQGDNKPMTTQVAIDGMRALAERTRLYRGQLGPFWCGEDGEWVDKWLSSKAPTACKVGVLREGWVEPMWGFARTAAYSKSNDFWTKLPDVMIAKVAESIALRKAFPTVLGGVYAPEEINGAQDDATYVDADPVSPQTPQTVTVTPEPDAPTKSTPKPEQKVAAAIAETKAKVAPPEKSVDQLAAEAEKALEERAIALGFTREQYEASRKFHKTYARTAAALNRYEEEQKQLAEAALVAEAAQDAEDVAEMEAGWLPEDGSVPSNDVEDEPAMTPAEMAAWDAQHDRYTKAGGDSVDAWNEIVSTAGGDLEKLTTLVDAQVFKASQGEQPNILKTAPQFAGSKGRN